MAAKPRRPMQRADQVQHPASQVETSLSIERVEASFSGPVPDPATLKAYDLVLPGLAERIIDRWEKQSDHRMALEKMVVQGDTKRANWGLASATVISLAVIGVSGVLAMHGHETVAAVLAGVDIAALAGVFIYGTNSRKEERIKKTKIMTDRPEN